MDQLTIQETGTFRVEALGPWDVAAVAFRKLETRAVREAREAKGEK